MGSVPTQGAANLTLDQQINTLEKILNMNSVLNDVIKGAQKLGLPNWYLGAGCISQTVWNYMHGYEASSHIKDYDLVYFDADISREAEQKYITHSTVIFKNLQAEVEVVNQARVHMWYEQDFGFKIPAYKSAEEGINSWPTTVTCIAVRRDDEKFEVYAPYGLNDLFSLILRPNKQIVTKEAYYKKVERWTKIWPDLKVVEW